MRPALFAAPLLVAVLPLAAAAQPGRYAATVTADGVSLRAGPSETMPETARLPRGTEVTVEQEQGDWLAVRADGWAVSWIATAFVEGFDPDKPTPQNATVNATAEVTLAAGAAGQYQPLAVRRAAVPSGTVLLVVGPPVKHDGKTWLPVQPPAGDFRYLKKGTVTPGKPAADNFAVRSTDTATPNAPPPPPAGSPAPLAGPVVAIGSSGSSGSVNHPLWVKAAQAEADGRLEDAEKFYYDLAREMNEPGKNHDLANLCFTRIHMLREKRRGLPAKATPAATTVAAGGTAREVFPPPVRDDRPAARDDPKPAARPSRDDRPPAASDDDAPHWTGPGRLVRAAVVLDGRQTYALEAAPGAVRMYVVSDGSVDLGQYQNKRVDLLGAVRRHRDVSKPYLVATKVELNP